MCNKGNIDLKFFFGMSGVDHLRDFDLSLA